MPAIRTSSNKPVYFKESSWLDPSLKSSPEALVETTTLFEELGALIIRPSRKTLDWLRSFDKPAKFTAKWCHRSSSIVPAPCQILELATETNGPNELVLKFQGLEESPQLNKEPLGWEVFIHNDIDLGSWLAIPLYPVADKWSFPSSEVALPVIPREFRTGFPLVLRVRFLAASIVSPMCQTPSKPGHTEPSFR